MFYRIAKVVLKFILIFIFRIEVRGRENMPKTGGVILAVNHKSCWDPVIAAVASPRKLRFMAKSELFRNKAFSFLITSLGAFPVHRGKGDMGAIKSALSMLKDEQVMLIFPEGGRMKDENSKEAKPGAVMIASRAKVPIVPTYISGNFRWFSKLTVTFGEPVYYDKYYEEKPVMQELQNLSNELLKTMRSLKV